MSAFLTDGSVSLRPLAREDLPQLAAWRNDPELRARTRELRPLTDEDQARWFARISSPDTRDFMFGLVAVDGVEDAFIGVVGLCHWVPRDRLAEVSFYIGPPEMRGRGYASKALRLLHAWGFNELGLERIYAETYAFNEPSLRLLERLGYQREGILREHVWRQGARADAVMLGLLRSEWSAQLAQEATCARS